jgi:hypothetical protein
MMMMMMTNSGSGRVFTWDDGWTAATSDGGW